MQDSPNASNDKGTSARKLAFTKAYNDYNVFFAKYFKRKTGNQQDAEDLSQEFWASVYTTFETHQFSHIRLLQHKAAQVFLASLRKKNVRSFVQLMRELPDLPDPRPNREDGTDANEKRIFANFWEMFPGVDLTETQKTVLWLKERHGYTFDELSVRYKKPVSTIADWIRKAKEECAASANREDL